MSKCETCGNSYAKAFQVVMNGKSHTFDCFECAIQALAPACAHCGCSIIGHGVDSGDDIYCCDHCARKSNEPSLDTGAADAVRPTSEPHHAMGDSIKP